MVAQRSIGHWRLFVAMAVGATLAAALMSSVILYSDAVRDLGLSHSLESQPQYSLDLRLVASSQKFNPLEEPRVRGVIDDLVDRDYGDVASSVVHYGRSATFFPTNPGQAVSTDENRPRAHLQFSDDLKDHINIVAGRLPQPFTPGQGDGPPSIEVLVGKDTADAQHLSVGQVLDLHPHWQEKAAPVPATIVGIIEPKDATDPYWFGMTDRFAITTTAWPTIPLFADEDTIAMGVGGYLPDMDGTLETYALLDKGAIDHNNARDVEDRVKALKADAQSRLSYSYAETTLDDVLKSYRDKLFFTRLPLFALMLQVVGIVLFYLVMVSAMVVERQAGEIALLKSRGAGTPQIMTVFGIESLGICGIATILGPLIAWGAIAVLGFTPPFEDLSNNDFLKVTLTPLAFAMALGGALLAMGALLWPAYRACKLSITTYKQQISRPPRQSAFLRYYLDLVLIAAAAFAFYQLRQNGSAVTEGLFGDLSADPLLLATPSLFMLMVALVFLRLFPLALRGLLWLVRGLKGATIPLGLTRMARSPLQHSRLILILILATAVGMFAAGFRSTLEQGYEDRASYKAGSEVRLEDIREPIGAPTGRFVDDISFLTGAKEISPALRMNAYYSPSRFVSRNVTLLAVDQATFPQIAYWRDDFAGDDPAGLMKKAVPAEPQGLAEGAKIPPGARFIGIWIQTPLSAAQAPIGIRLRDKDGSPWEFRMFTESQVSGGQSTPNTWQFYVTDLQRQTTGTRPNGPVPSPGDRQWVVDGIYVQLPGAPPMVPQQVSVLFDDLQTAPDGGIQAGWGSSGFTQGTVVEDFESIDRYELSRGASNTADPGSLSRSPAPAPREGNVMRLSFTRGRGGPSVVAAQLKTGLDELPMLASDKFLSDNDVSVGDEISVFVNSQYVNMRLVGSVDLFPTFDPDGGSPLLVADLKTFQQAVTRVPGLGGNIYPNEAWLGPGTPGGLTKDGLAKRDLSVENVYDRSVILADESADPLIAASWEGILFLAFAAVLIVSTLGFITYTTLGAQARSLEFAILRTMGLSGRQVLGVVSFEQVFVVLAGVITGTLLGFPLSRLMIGYLGLTEDGKDPLPPLQSVVNWQSVGTVYALLGVVVVATVISLVLLYSRLAVSRALRMGEL